MGEGRRDCAFIETTDDGQLRYKLRGRVFKQRRVDGEEAEWVVLAIVHDAVRILLDLNDDPTHLFGYDRGAHVGHVLLSVMPKRLARFRDHLNQLFSTSEQLSIPHAVPALDDADDANADAGSRTPWAFNTRQFRRTLAWHIAHQPFGIVAGAKQYKNAKLAMFDGYAGTSASGFAAEVAAEEAVALLDYAPELYRDWNDGGRAGGGATARIDAEFTRIRRELGDLPGVIANPARLRTMLGRLTKTLHPGVCARVVNDQCRSREAMRRSPTRGPVDAGTPLAARTSCPDCDGDCCTRTRAWPATSSTCWTGPYCDGARSTH
jgi:hypothetical protein